MPASSTKTDWVLERWVDDGRSKERIQIKSLPFTIGRSSECSMAISEEDVSKNHAEITLFGNKLLIADNNSTNGTFVNGVRIDDVVPLKVGDLVGIANNEFKVVATTKEVRDVSQQFTMRAGSATAKEALSFGKLLQQEGVVPHFQSIVRFSNEEIIGYEVLGRGEIDGSLSSPARLFAIAQRYESEVGLSDIFRVVGIQSATQLPSCPRIFLNTHPKEVEDPDELITSVRELRTNYPGLPIVMEIHEAAVANRESFERMIDAFRSINVQIAFDDFGAGQARLEELVDFSPAYLKFDRRLIADIGSAAPTKQSLLRAFVQLAQDIGTITIAEGVETEEEKNACIELGFELAQGYYYSRPEAVTKMLETKSLSETTQFINNDTPSTRPKAVDKEELDGTASFDDDDTVNTNNPEE